MRPHVNATPDRKPLKGIEATNFALGSGKATKTKAGLLRIKPPKRSSYTARFKWNPDWEPVPIDSWYKWYETWNWKSVTLGFTIGAVMAALIIFFGTLFVARAGYAPETRQGNAPSPSWNELPVVGDCRKVGDGIYDCTEDRRLLRK